MAYFIITRKRGNWQRFNGQICFVERRFFTNLTSSGPPTDMGGKYSLRCSALTASRTYFAIRAAFARRGTIMLKYRYFGALKGWAKESTSLNARQAHAAIWVSRFTPIDALYKLKFNLVNIEKLCSRTYVPAAYYPRRRYVGFYSHAPPLISINSRKSSNARRTATVRLEIGTGRQWGDWL